MQNGFCGSWFLHSAFFLLPFRLMVRLQKFLADAGVASRRAGEQIMLAGRVTVNAASSSGNATSSQVPR